MALEAGTQFGSYEVGESIGAGGMGEVYLARDTSLKRDVALKVLPPAFVEDADRLARFQREAEILASLNHSNIAQVYGLERSDGQTAIAMELVEGPTLADRIAEGSIPPDEAMSIALQIVAALEAAHEKQIVHRDLKPANIKVRDDGTVKVLDFGIAKASASVHGTAGQYSTATLSGALTEAGALLGTAAYMAPEQARGKDVDQRADIWAFGCVLYEMLTGQAAFSAEDLTTTLARVLERDANMALLPAGAGPHVRLALKLCFEKDPNDRIADIRDVRLALEGRFGSGPRADDPAAYRRALAPGIALVAGIALTALAMWSLRPDMPELPLNHFQIRLPDDHQLRFLNWDPVVLSPDGRRFVYNTLDGLYVRDMGAVEPRLIPNTEKRLAEPAFSPDGRSLVYTSDNVLERMSITGGQSRPLADGVVNVSARSWGNDDTILFTNASGIFRVPADGGDAQLVIEAREGELLTRPELLPDGDTVLFTVADVMADWDQAQVVAASLATGERTVVVEGGADAHFLPTGHLVYAAGTELFAIAFDVDTLSVSVERVLVADGVQRSEVTGSANYSIADDGTLLYLSGSTSTSPVWVDRSGNRVDSLPFDEPSFHLMPSISPDGGKVAITRMDGGVEHVWIHDVVRGSAPQRITHERTGRAAWSPDGEHVVYMRGVEVFRRAADGTGVEEQLASLPTQARPLQITPNGEQLLLQAPWSGASSDLYTLSLIRPEVGWVPLLDEEYTEAHAALSPNGRFLAYTSDETGQNEIYVRPYPNVNEGGKWRVSRGGGESPRWRSDGLELFYSNDDAIVAIGVTTDPNFDHTEPQTLFTGSYWTLPDSRPNWDVHPDGQRFLMLETRRNSVINIVQNAHEEIERLIAAQRGD